MNLVRAEARGEIFSPQGRYITINATRKAMSGFFRKYLPDKSEHILELGCGAGFFYREIADPQLKGRLVGIDRHLPSIDAFRNSAPRARVMQGDARNLSFHDESMDVVLGFSAYPLFGSSVDVLRETRRVLKPGGRLLILQDSSIVSNYFVKNAIATLEERHEKLEKAHQSLTKQVAETGFDLIQQSGYIEAAVKVQRKEIEQRFQIFSPQDLRLQIRPGYIIAGYIRTPERAQIVTVERSSFKQEINLVEFLNDMSGKDISALHLKPGQDAFEFSRIRCIVASKQ